MLPYKKQFFICDADFIHFIGLDATDPDWKKIDFDWVKPTNCKAWERLNRKLSKLGGNNDE